MKKIAFILPYFGQFPNYFDFFLESCKKNPTVNFFIFTDNEIKFHYPNIQIIHTSLQEIKERIENLYKFKIKLDRPYRLCVFKPAYGEIFQKELENFDFWGYCDCDLIFGDIRYFISNDILEKYDRILSRGHFTLYRNNKIINEIFKKDLPNVPTWKDIFSKNITIAFDEWGGTSKYWEIFKKEKFYDEIIFDDINIRFKHFESYQKVVKKFHDEPKKNCFFIKKGDSNLYRVTDCGEEKTLYLHLQKRNMKISKNCTNRDSFICVPNIFLPYTDIYTHKNEIIKYCKKRYIYWHFLKIRLNNLLRKIKFYFQNKTA